MANRHTSLNLTIYKIHIITVPVRIVISQIAVATHSWHLVILQSPYLLNLGLHPRTHYNFGLFLTPSYGLRVFFFTIMSRKDISTV